MTALLLQTIEMAKWLEGGALLGVCGALFWFINKMHGDHRQERAEWRDSTVKQGDDWQKAADRRSDRTDEAFKELTNAIRERKLP